MSVWERIKKAWKVLWYGLEEYYGPEWAAPIQAALGDTHTVAAKRAIEKLRNEPQTAERFSIYRDATGEEKRKEVLQWAKYYGKKLGVKEPSDWRYNFAIEYFVGKEKGLL